MPLTINKPIVDDAVELEEVSSEKLNTEIEKRSQLDFQKHSKFGGFFYLAGYTGVLLSAPTLLLHSMLAVVSGILLLLLACLRFYLAILASRGQLFSSRLIALVLASNVLVWSCFVSLIIYKINNINSTVAIALAASSAYAAGVIVVTTGNRKLQRQVLAIFFIPPILSFSFFMSNAEAFTVAIMSAVYFFFLDNLGKGQSHAHRNALATAIRLDLQTTALRTARNEALAASKAKSDFLSHMSHEIRTPLNGVIGASELLAISTSDPQLQGYVKTIQESGELLMGLLNNILDFSRISSKAIVLSPETVKIIPLVKTLLTMMEPMAQKKGIALNFHGANDLPAFLRVDPLRLQQVIVNLLTNSLKFTNTGSITLRLSTWTRTNSELCLRCEIVDTGVGIAKENLSKIFEQFIQVENFHSEIRGAGLGLNICQQLIKLMGGELGVNSELGVGSTFWFEVPVCLGENTTPKASQPKQAGAVPSKPYARTYKLISNAVPEVLIAEDNLINQKVIEQLLKRFNVNVSVTNNGEEALAKFSSKQPDIVFMDCNMPILDGMAATRRLREVELERGWQRTPVVALTAHAFQDAIQQCMESGMDDHLSKPLRLADFNALFEKWVKKANFTQQP